MFDSYPPSRRLVEIRGVYEVRLASRLLFLPHSFLGRPGDLGGGKMMEDGICPKPGFVEGVLFYS